jgi:aspartyl-tRNA(Asn)/glutamyl-tRNA(Gln) amidotransferase subunit C
MSNQLSTEDVAKVANLARLELSLDEQERLKSHLNGILDQFARLQELDTTGVELTSHSLPMRNVFREDVAGVSLPREDATRNAPEKRDGNFIVPQIVDS